jgi:DNA-binding NarL/FixJ family response regulator
MDRIRVILAEDHVLVREGTRELLDREQDIEVVAEAGDGEEAVRLTDAYHPDVVAMDIAMPVLNGVEATRRIKATNPATAVLVLSAYDDDQYVYALLEAGAAGYLLKDVSASALVHAIRAVHAGESVLHPAVARKVIGHLVQGKAGADGEPAVSIPSVLSGSELQVLTLAARWMTNGEIASELGIDARAVQAHLSSIFRKLDVGSRMEAVLYAMRKGWILREDRP